MCLPNILFPVFMFAFIFHCCSFSPCWPLAFPMFSPPVWISMFFFLRNSSRSSSFSVIHVSVNKKNNAEKGMTLLFFLSKSPGGHVISFQIKPWVAFGLPYLLIELFYVGMPVVRTDGGGRAVRRCTVTWIPNFPGWCILAMGLRPRATPLWKVEGDWGDRCGKPLSPLLLPGFYFFDTPSNFAPLSTIWTPGTG